MIHFILSLSVLWCLSCSAAWAWGNHSPAAYRALEHMPEVATAEPVRVETLGAFLKAEQVAIADLLSEQEAWASRNMAHYPARPGELAFFANRWQSEEARRMAFLKALRVAPNSRFALYVQPDPRLQTPAASELPYAAVSALPEPRNGTHRFVSLKSGQTVTALQVVASACDEPDYGLDTNLWSDSPGEWGKQYGFGPLPFGKSGNPDSDGVSQLPFHTGFFHEGSLTYQSEPLLQKTLALWRVHQYEGLSMLAWRTGHAYWGWRFAGMALHYVQDLTQPYHASAAPGTSTLRLTAINLLAMAGLPSQKDELAVLQSNRRQALEKYQAQLLHQASVKHQDTALVQALRTPRQDASYPPWSEHYARDVVAAEARAHAAAVAEALLAALPARLVADPAFDFGQQEAQLDLLAELNRQAPARRARLDNTLAELMIHFATHSRNVLRGLLAAQP